MVVTCVAEDSCSVIFSSSGVAAFLTSPASSDSAEEGISEDSGVESCDVDCFSDAWLLSSTDWGTLVCAEGSEERLKENFGGSKLAVDDRVADPKLKLPDTGFEDSDLKAD